MNTDLGDPLFAAADGIVVYAGIPSEGWGKVLILSHRLADGQCFQTMYAHLQKIDVALGSMTARGQQIGTVGSADGLYPAHLHYEIHQGYGVTVGSGYGAEPLNRVNPEKFRQMHAAAADDLRPAASRIIKADLAQREADVLFNQLNNRDNREKLLEILERK